MTSDDISILITGDYCPDRRTERLCREGSWEKIYNDFLPVLKSADIRIANLECPLTESDTTIEKIGPSLKAHPQTIEGIKFGGFNVLTLANNHIRDYGDQGIRDTLSLCKTNGIRTVGAGMNLREASQVLILNVRNLRIAILNICEHEFSIATADSAGANPLNPVENYYQIVEAKAQSDILIVIVHGGVEMFEYPSPRMVNTYRFFADLGASVVINHHTHCISGHETYKGVPIFYSLGNFVFDRQGRPEKFYLGFALKLLINPARKISFEIVPYYQFRDEVGLRLINTQTSIQEFHTHQEKISATISDSALLNQKNEQHFARIKTSYLFDLYGYGKLRRKIIRKLNLFHVLIKRKKLMKILNHIECEAHRDVLIGSIKQSLTL